MRENLIKSNYAERNFDIARYDQTLSINVTYPGWSEGDSPESVRFIKVNQESVRASDGIRLSYDYQRDGWSIQQPKSREVEVSDGVFEFQQDWIETAFVQSWALDDPIS